MKLKLLLSVSLIALGLNSMYADNAMPLKSRKSIVSSDLTRSSLPKFEQKKAPLTRTDQTSSSIEGEWLFSLGDYYFEDSSMQTKEVEIQASFFNHILYFETEDEDILPFAANFDENTSLLTFNSGQFGDFYGYGVLVQLPSIYNTDTQKFEVKSFQAQYIEDEGKIEFPENSAIQWWLYDYSLTPMFSLDAYTIEGAVKITKHINSLIINKDEEESLQLKFSDFSRIDFKDGYLVFDNQEELSIPLSSLLTIHFGEYVEDDIEDAGVESVELDQDVNLLYGNGWLAVTGLASGVSLEIYSVNGSKVKAVKDYTGEKIDIRDLDRGVFIINSGKYSFKIVK